MDLRGTTGRYQLESRGAMTARGGAGMFSSSLKGSGGNNMVLGSTTNTSMKLFSTIAMIGQGGYAIVRVVKHRVSARVFALKQIAKCDFLQVSQLRMAITEAEILHSRLQMERRHKNCESAATTSGGCTTSATGGEESNGSLANAPIHIGLGPGNTASESSIRAFLENHGYEYFPEFYGSWQDNHFIFFLMEYLPGGDLMKHLMDMEIFTETVARYYVAQLALAVGYLHDVIGYAHRDLKPDNILFDKHGNIKLLDFGLSKALPDIDPVTKRRPMIERFHSAVGTPDYMAPEVHRSDHTHCRTVDWWSLGIIMYEMLYGGPPFSDRHHRPDQTARLIRHWKEYMRSWPSHPRVSNEAIDLMSHLIAEHKDRYKSAEQVLSHPWFEGLDLRQLRRSAAPIIPCTSSAEDVRNFDSFSMTRLQEWESQKKSQPIRAEVAAAAARQDLIPKSVQPGQLPASGPPSGSMTSRRDYCSVDYHSSAAQATPRLPGHFTGAMSSLQKKLTTKCTTLRGKNESAASCRPQHATQPAVGYCVCNSRGLHSPNCPIFKSITPSTPAGFMQRASPLSNQWPSNFPRESQYTATLEAQVVPRPLGHIKVQRAVQRGSLTERNGVQKPYEYLFRSNKTADTRHNENAPNSQRLSD